MSKALDQFLYNLAQKQKNLAEKDLILQALADDLNLSYKRPGWHQISTLIGEWKFPDKDHRTSGLQPLMLIYQRNPCGEIPLEHCLAVVVIDDFLTLHGSIVYSLADPEFILKLKADFSNLPELYGRIKTIRKKGY